MTRPITDLELLILLAVARLTPKAYGVSIAHEIEMKGRRVLSLGTVYAVLERMEQIGFVTSELGDATPERGGRSKRFFRVTAAGLEQVRSTRKALSDMWKGLPELEAGLA
jgi:PadR family transcriptional regulator PadR